MKFYPDEFQLALADLGAERVVEKFVRLRKAGRRKIGLCPFHDETSPSFVLSEDGKTWFCYGCGQGGDATKFVMKKLGLGFDEAVRWIAANCGGPPVPPEAEARFAAKRESDERLFAACKAAAEFYFRNLRSPNGKRGMEYFVGRGLTRETMREFGLGFADPSGDTMTKALLLEGFSKEDLVTAGLSVEKIGGRLADRFWNRVMFPIVDPDRRVIGFGGRAMDDAKPKYLNSSETPIFVKKANLYGYAAAAASGAGEVVICEGYMDVIAMRQAGFPNCVASLGTALTEEHCDMIAKIADRVVLSYDSDKAGRSAAERAVPRLERRGLTVKALELSPSKDPDEFVKTFGKDAMARRIREAEPRCVAETRAAGAPATPAALGAAAYTRDDATTTVAKIRALSYAFHAPMVEVASEARALRAKDLVERAARPRRESR